MGLMGDSDEGTELCELLLSLRHLRRQEVDDRLRSGAGFLACL